MNAKKTKTVKLTLTQIKADAAIAMRGVAEGLKIDRGIRNTIAAAIQAVGEDAVRTAYSEALDLEFPVDGDKETRKQAQWRLRAAFKAARDMLGISVVSHGGKKAAAKKGDEAGDEAGEEAGDKPAPVRKAIAQVRCIAALALSTNDLTVLGKLLAQIEAYLSSKGK